MTKTTARNAIILINGYNFSTFATAFEAKADAGKIEVSSFGQAAANFIPGLQLANMTADLFWDSDADSVHAALSSLPTGHVTIIPAGYALGNPSLSMPFMSANYGVKGAPAEALTIGTLSFESYGSNNGVELGNVLAHGEITATATGVGSDDQSGAAVTAACSGVIHIWKPCAADRYVVKIQHSTAIDSGYADLITFVADGATRTAERIVVDTGVINRYRRVIATRTGSAANPFGFSVHFWHG